MSHDFTTLYSFSFSHHGHYSSFHRFLHYARGHRTIDITLPIPKFLNAKIGASLVRRWMHLAEWRLRPIFAKRQRQCIHYLYPENSLFRGPKWKGQHRLVISCHQPASCFGSRKTFEGTAFFEALNRSDRVVLLSESFVSGYKQFCDVGKLRVIPHGVDVHFFRPAEQLKKKPLVVTVGNWLRDYDFWASTVLRLAIEMPQVDFAVVAQPSVVGDSFARVEAQLGTRVRLLNGLSDDAFRDLYRKATLLFLPLKDAGANNALLEAMSSGLPVLVSDLPATREYAGDTAMFFSPDNLEECVAKMKNLLTDANLRSNLAASSRKRAMEQFSWEAIAGQYERLYAEVLEE
jgi:glycosyltransferase involved in cell wall biosynthesis